METTALYIGYAILGVLALAIAAFAVGLVWFAIAESRALILSRKWRKRKLSQLQIETAYNCANYLRRWDLPSDMTIFEIENHFYKKLNKKKDESK